MKVVHSLAEIPPITEDVSLTIGVYDGLHLGHQTIIKKLCDLSKKKSKAVVLTFANHPSTYLRPNSPSPLLITLPHRLRLLREMGINLTIVLPFDAPFARQSYQDFFFHLCNRLPIKKLIVGTDARFGKDRAGDSSALQALGLFETMYFSKEKYSKEEISSGLIRSYVQAGKLKKVKKMLGRPYSLLLPLDRAHIAREEDLQHKWVTGIEDICLLPDGIYAVSLIAEKRKIAATASYRGSRMINGKTELSLTLIFDKPLPEASTVEIVFLSHLHSEPDAPLTTSSRAHLLKTLKSELFPLTSKEVL